MAANLHIGRFFTERGSIRNELIGSIQIPEFVQSLIIECTNRAHSTIDHICCQVKILANMAGIQEEIPVAAGTVSPGRSFRYCAPPERNGTFPDVWLFQAHFADLRRKIIPRFLFALNYAQSPGIYIDRVPIRSRSKQPYKSQMNVALHQKVLCA